MRTTIGLTLALLLTLAGCDALSPRLSPESFLRAEISGAERIRHEAPAHYNGAYSGTFGTDILYISSGERQQDTARVVHLTMLGSQTAEVGDVYSVVADPYSENVPEKALARYYVQVDPRGVYEITNYIASSGELRIEEVGDSLYAGTFWFRAFRTDSTWNGWPASPPEDTEWIRVEGEFSATQSNPVSLDGG